jgi:REP-associated tyrosine transposase
MPRRARAAPGGLVYHVFNRSVGRMVMFRRDSDYQAFERVIHQAQELHPIRILSYCVMPNHWHWVVWPEEDGQLTGFFRWLTHTHAMRWRVSHHTVGYGHLYQGRFKSFPVESDEHLFTVCRYVERNPLAAGLVQRAQDWRWSSLWVTLKGTDQQKSILSPWPVDRGENWTTQVNQPLHETDLEAVEKSLERGRPLGSAGWTLKVAARLELEHTMRPQGRPKKPKSGKCENELRPRFMSKPVATIKVALYDRTESMEISSIWGDYSGAKSD